MLITKDFVFIHLPKTGGSYFIKSVTDILHKHYHIAKESFLHRALRKLYLDYTFINYHVEYRGFPHQPDTKIPAKYQNRQIISIIRNPFRKWVSAYNFDFWRRHPEYFHHFSASKDEIEKVAPAFFSSNLSFKDFIIVMMLKHFY